MSAPLTYPPGERHDRYDAPKCGVCGYPLEAGKCEPCAEWAARPFAGIPNARDEDNEPF